MLRTTVNEISSPLTLPSEIGVSPCRPETVPVNLSPSAFRLKVVSRVWPFCPVIWATHLPVTSAAQAADTSPATKNEAAKNAVLSFIEYSPSEFDSFVWISKPLQMRVRDIPFDSHRFVRAP